MTDVKCPPDNMLSNQLEAIHQRVVEVDASLHAARELLERMPSGEQELNDET